MSFRRDVAAAWRLAQERQQRQGSAEALRSRRCIVAEVRGRACTCGHPACPAAKGKPKPVVQVKGPVKETMAYMRCPSKWRHAWCDLRSVVCTACGTDLRIKKRGGK